ncbi:DNA-processing protein DprA [Halobacillus litoralis]|uniref:DNA-processing protein DprA n=1 Tax=Halobacillus litoralis TaxID=45668 RepID=UPI001CD3576D|nr:DNA-processing protein DprA [Halobacillus litoralis]MCA0969153.1 DNA-processing protein DprA [Halobacillus litoralis]
MNLTKRLAVLHHSPNVTRPLLKKCFRLNPDLIEIFEMSKEDLSYHLKIPLERSALIHHHIHDPYIMKKVDIFYSDYHMIPFYDSLFPPLLKTIPDPPLMLYIQGDPLLMHTPSSLSVIGTRTPSGDAFPAMKYILSPILSKGYTVVSGMAKGVDQYAHHLAIDHGSKTIAVLGSGFEHIYPRNDIPLYEKLARDHLVISEYPPDRKPKKYHFPERNRLISGLTLSTFVVEARVRSGSLITVDQALEQGRNIFAMPGRPGSPTSEGCHQMINDGAKLVHRAEDILSEWSEKFE